MSDFFLLHLTDKTNAKLTTIFVILNSSLRNDVYGKSTVYYSRLTFKNTKFTFNCSIVCLLRHNGLARMW